MLEIGKIAAKYKNKNKLLVEHSFFYVHRQHHNQKSSVCQMKGLTCRITPQNALESSQSDGNALNYSNLDNFNLIGTEVALSKQT